MKEDVARARSDTRDAEAVTVELHAASERIDHLNREIQVTSEVKCTIPNRTSCVFQDAQRENSRVTEDLHRQQKLFNELKKMKGMGEEVDLLRESQQARTVPRSVNVLMAIHARRS